MSMSGGRMKQSASRKVHTYQGERECHRMKMSHPSTTMRVHVGTSMSMSMSMSCQLRRGRRRRSVHRHERQRQRQRHQRLSSLAAIIDDERLGSERQDESQNDDGPCTIGWNGGGYVYLKKVDRNRSLHIK